MSPTGIEEAGEDSIGLRMRPQKGSRRKPIQGHQKYRHTFVCLYFLPVLELNNLNAVRISAGGEGWAEPNLYFIPLLQNKMQTLPVRSAPMKNITLLELQDATKGNTLEVLPFIQIRTGSVP